jgi:hypothetical protein
VAVCHGREGDAGRWPAEWTHSALLLPGEGRNALALLGSGHNGLDGGEDGDQRGVGGRHRGSPGDIGDGLAISGEARGRLPGEAGR